MGFFKLTVALCLIISAVVYAAPSNNQDDVEGKPFFPYAHCYDHLTPDHFNASSRNGIIPEQYRWPRGVIPYVLEDSVKAADLDSIKGGFKLVQDATCLTFVERTIEQNYITIGTTQKGKCFCKGIGMRGGSQQVNLANPGCNIPSTAAHEFLHAAGLEHEQARPDRDDYITVVWSNILKVKWSQYERCDEPKYPGNDGCDTYGQAYNTKSIMHYPGMGGFAIDNTKPVMISKIKGVELPKDVTVNNRLTAEDAAKINIMYNNCQ